MTTLVLPGEGVDAAIGRRRADSGEPPRGECTPTIAWQRAMEQAQCESWFRHPEGRVASPRMATKPSAIAASASPESALAALGGKAVGLDAARNTEVAATAPAEASGVPVRLEWAMWATSTRESAARPRPAQSAASNAAAEPSTEPRARPGPGAALETIAEALQRALTAGLVAKERVHAPPPCADAAHGAESQPSSPGRPQEGAAGRSAADESVRVHVDWSEKGVRVWLGVDEPDSVALAQGLRFLVPRLRSWLAAHGAPLRAVVCNGRRILDREAAESVALDVNDREAFEPHHHQEEVP